MSAHEILLSSIVVLPDRQRKEFGALSELAASISRIGLLQYPVVTPVADFNEDDPKYTLIAGERRLRALQMLQSQGKWNESVPVRLLSDLTPAEYHLIELEENFRRKDLEWWEMIEGVARYTRAAEALGKTMEEIAASINISISNLSKMMKVALAVGANEKLRSASSWTACYTGLTTREDKTTHAAIEDILADITMPVQPAASAVSSGVGEAVEKSASGKSPTEVKDRAREEAALAGSVAQPPPAPGALTGLRYAYQADFREWVSSYRGRRFNLVHCDFPYGLNMDTAKLQGASSRWAEGEDGRYSDSPDLYWSLLNTFLKNMDRFLADSAHIIFWLAPKNLNGTIGLMNSAKLWVCDYPLIWHKSDSSGIAPDTNRQPRRTYEMAILASRGDRKLAKLKAASISAAPTRINHLSEKPLEVVHHFLEMVVDETTYALDPTCGSGTALEAVIRLGGSGALGLDVQAQHAAHTHQRIERVLHQRAAVVQDPAPGDDPGDGSAGDDDGQERDV